MFTQDAGPLWDRSSTIVFGGPTQSGTVRVHTADVVEPIRNSSIPSARVSGLYDSDLRGAQTMLRMFNKDQAELVLGPDSSVS